MTPAQYAQDCPADVRALFAAHAWDALTECGRVLRGPMLCPHTRRLSAEYERHLSVLHVVSLLLDHVDVPRAAELRERVERLSEYAEIQMDRYESYIDDMEF